MVKKNLDSGPRCLALVPGPGPWPRSLAQVPGLGPWPWSLAMGLACGHAGLYCVAMQVSTVWPCRSLLLCGNAGLSYVTMQAILARVQASDWPHKPKPDRLALPQAASACLGRGRQQPAHHVMVILPYQRKDALSHERLVPAPFPSHYTALCSLTVEACLCRGAPTPPAGQPATNIDNHA